MTASTVTSRPKAPGGAPRPPAAVAVAMVILRPARPSLFPVRDEDPTQDGRCAAARGGLREVCIPRRSGALRSRGRPLDEPSDCHLVESVHVTFSRAPRISAAVAVLSLEVVEETGASRTSRGREWWSVPSPSRNRDLMCFASSAIVGHGVGPRSFSRSIASAASLRSGRASHSRSTARCNSARSARVGGARAEGSARFSSLALCPRNLRPRPCAATSSGFPRKRSSADFKAAR